MTGTKPHYDAALSKKEVRVVSLPFTLRLTRREPSMRLCPGLAGSHCAIVGVCVCPSVAEVCQ